MITSREEEKKMNQDQRATNIQLGFLIWERRTRVLMLLLFFKLCIFVFACNIRSTKSVMTLQY